MSALPLKADIGISSELSAWCQKQTYAVLFDFHEVRSAHEYVEKGDTEGKVVLKVAV